MGEPGAGFRWDFFVSHATEDQPWAEWIAWTLEQEGHRVLIQAWDMVPGLNWVARMHEGARHAARMIAVVSQAYLDSIFNGVEWYATFSADPEGAGRRLIPVQVARCKRHGLLGQLVAVDVFDLDESTARKKLLDAVRSAATGRAKPTAAPGFPGGPHPAAPIPADRPSFPGLPAVWNLQRGRNGRFTGRETTLSRLAAGLAGPGSSMTVQSVRGMGGVGKTEVATEYAYRFASQFDIVWWVAAEEPVLIEAQIAALGVRLGIAATDTAELAAATRIELGRRSRWLIIFDNVEDPANLAGWPPGNTGQVLVTTRRAGFAAVGDVVSLDVWKRAETVAFLTSRITGVSPSEAHELASTVGDLPLAAEQAAAYLEKTQIPAREYLRLWHARAEELLNRGQVRGHPHTLATLWSLSLDRLERTRPAAVELLRACSLLAPEPVPIQLFDYDPAMLPAVLASAVTNDVERADTIGALFDYSLITRTVDTLSVHRLVQTAVRASTSARHRSELSAAMVRLFAGLLPEDVEAPTSWPIWREFLPHVLAVLEPRSTDEGSTQAASLARRAAVYLGVHGQTSRPIDLLKSATAVFLRSLGPDHPHTLGAKHDLAFLRGLAGDRAAAVTAFEELLADDLRFLGPDHPITLGARHDLAYWKAQVGNPSSAVTAFEALLVDVQRVLGPDHPRTLATRHSLAYWRGKTGDPAGAVTALQQLLADSLRVHGPDHPHTLGARHNLAYWREQAGEPAGIAASHELLADYFRLLGPNHPDTLAARRDLAIRYGAAGDPAGAAAALQELASDWVRVRGPNHPDTLAARRDHAVWRGEAGDPVGAATALQDLVAAYARVLGPDHPDTLTTLRELTFWRKDAGGWEPPGHSNEAD